MLQRRLTRQVLLSLRPAAPPWLGMHRLSSLLVFALCRQQAGISQLTFRKCHKEGEKRRHPRARARPSKYHNIREKSLA